MAFTIEDFQDLIRLLGEHPEWRAELRRHVLSDDLLELPGLIRELVGTQARGESRLQRLEAIAERLESAIERLIEAQGRTETRVGRTEGEVLELRYARRAPAYFSRLARRLRVLDTSALADLLDDAVQHQTLVDEERHAVLAADLVLTGRRREDDAEVYLVAEVSAGIGPDDVERAADRAAVLEKLGRPAMAIVAGRQIIAEAAELATRRRVWWVLDGTPAREP